LAMSDSPNPHAAVLKKINTVRAARCVTACLFVRAPATPRHPMISKTQPIPDPRSMYLRDVEPSSSCTTVWFPSPPTCGVRRPRPESGTPGSRPAAYGNAGLPEFPSSPSPIPPFPCVLPSGGAMRNPSRWMVRGGVSSKRVGSRSRDVIGGERRRKICKKNVKTWERSPRRRTVTEQTRKSLFRSRIEKLNHLSMLFMHISPRTQEGI